MSISKAQIKNIKSLHQSKFRKEHGLFIIEGEKLIKEAKSSGAVIDAIYGLDEDWCIKNNAVCIAPHEMAQISCLASPSPYLAVVHHLEFQPLNSVEKTLYLDGIKDPGNLGTILRSADAFGWRQIVLAPHCVELYNPKVIQSTMGSVFHVCVSIDEDSSFLATANKENREVIGADLKGNHLKEMAMPEKNAVLVIGSESHGISESVKEKVNRLVRIEQPGNAESLNASIAASILMHHWYQL